MLLKPHAIITLLLAIIGGVAAWIAWHAEQAVVTQQLVGFPQSVGMGHEIRPWLLASLFLLPALLGVLYAIAGALDRYLLRLFYSAVVLCFGALLLIWGLVDLQDNITEFQRAPNTLAAAGTFYLAQLPAIAVIILPNTLLFSLLFVLGRMSASREIVATIQTGRSVPRIVAPLLLVGLVCTYTCVVFNYHYAPYAEGAKDRILDRVAGREESSAKNVAYFSRRNDRMWSVKRFPADLMSGKPLETVSVTVKQPDGTFDYRLHAARAFWSADDRDWRFEDVIISKNEEPAPRNLAKLPAPLRTKWSETPWQIIQPGLSQLHLGIPGLNAWLSQNADSEWIDRLPYRTQWHYRWAQPFICVVTILLAAPLGIVFSRRGTAGGVIIAVFLSAMMLLSGNVFLALGEAGFIPPVAAAWATNVLFTIIALVLFQRRLSGRPIYQTLQSVFTRAT